MASERTVVERTTRTDSRDERRSQTIAGKLRRGQHAIEREIERNRGSYPFNSGWLTEAEVCRRAGVSPDCLQASEAGSARRDLEAWLRKASGVGVTAPDPASADLQAASDLRAQLEEIAAGYEQANIELAALRRRFDDLAARERALVEMYARLDGELCQGSVEDQRPARA